MGMQAKEHSSVACSAHVRLLVKITGRGTNLKQELLIPWGVVLPYMGCIGMCVAKGYDFSAVLDINRVSISAILPPFW